MTFVKLGRNLRKRNGQTNEVRGLIGWDTQFGRLSCPSGTDQIGDGLLEQERTAGLDASSERGVICERR
jgi:hypothetical protein